MKNTRYWIARNREDVSASDEAMLTGEGWAGILYFEMKSKGMKLRGTKTKGLEA
jgi:hypothetical protein